MSEIRVAKLAYEFCRFDRVVDSKATGTLIPYRFYFRLDGPPVKFCRIVVETDNPEVAVSYVMRRFPGAQLIESAIGGEARQVDRPKRFISYTHGCELQLSLQRSAA